MKPRSALIAGIVLLVAAQAVAMHAPSRHDATELPPGEFAGTLMLGGFRGVACDLLWLRAVSAKEGGRFYESVALVEAITRVQPHFVDVWMHLAHDLAYNIAHEADGEEGRWAWFVAGVRENARGCERNPGVERLLRNLAWIFHHRGDLFHARIESADWTPMINPLLADVRKQIGDDPRAADLPAGPGNSNFAIANRLYTACVALGDTGHTHVPAFVRRMAAHDLDADGNRLRNRGEHLAGLKRWIDCGEEWARIKAWCDAIKAGTPDESQRGSTIEVYERVEGRLRRKAADLAETLAPDPATGKATAAAITERRWEDARRLLAGPGWKASAGATARIRWLDE